MKLKLKDTVLDSNIILAPMAGVTDLPFRLLCREQGAGMAVTEMVSAKAILYKNKNTRELMAVDPADDPASRPDAYRVQGGKCGHAGDEESYGLVHKGNETLSGS